MDSVKVEVTGYLTQMKDLFANNLGNAIELLLILSQRTDERDLAVKAATWLALLKEAIDRLGSK